MGLCFLQQQRLAQIWAPFFCTTASLFHTLEAWDSFVSEASPLPHALEYITLNGY